MSTWKYFIKKVVFGAVLVFLLNGFSSKKANAQEISFSQYYANILYINPAFTGARVCPNLFFTFLSRYPGIDQRGYVGGVSYDAYMNKLKGGFGAKLYYENQGGVFSNLTASVLYSYRVKFSEEAFLNAGAELIYYNRSLDVSNLVFEDQLDPVTNEVIAPTQETFTNKSLNFADIAAGLLFNHDYFFLGASVKNIIRPYNSFTNSDSRLNMRMTFHGGARMVVESQRSYQSDFEILPNFLYQNSQGVHYINAGLYLTKLPIVTGVWYKYNNAIVLLAGIQFDKISIGYSYDVLTSRFAQNSYGSHELTLRFNMKCFKEKRKINSVKCPLF